MFAKVISMGAQLPLLLATLAVLCVACFMVSSPATCVDDPLVFWACVGVLCAGLAVLATPRQRVEGFFESAEAVINEVVLPSMDRLAKALTPGEAASGEEDAKTEKTVQIDEQRYPGMSPAALEQLKLQYKRVAFFLCTAKAADEDKYNTLMARLGAPAPTYEEEDEEEDEEA